MAARRSEVVTGIFYFILFNLFFRVRPAADHHGYGRLLRKLSIPAAKSCSVHDMICLKTFRICRNFFEHDRGCVGFPKAKFRNT